METLNKGDEVAKYLRRRKMSNRLRWILEAVLDALAVDDSTLREALWKRFAHSQCDWADVEVEKLLRDHSCLREGNHRDPGPDEMLP